MEDKKTWLVTHRTQINEPAVEADDYQIVTLEGNQGLTINHKDGSLTVSGGLTVSGAETKLTGGLTVSGIETKLNTGLTVSGAETKLTGGLTVSGAETKLTGGLTVSGTETKLTGGLTVSGGETKLTGNLKVSGPELLLDNPTRRGGKTGEYRRALAHADNDVLAINFGGDYQGGVLVEGTGLTLSPKGTFKIGDKELDRLFQSIPKVAFRTQANGGYYLGLSDSNSDRIVCTAKSVSDKEKFGIVNCGFNTIALLASNNKFVSYDNSELVNGKQRVFFRADADKVAKKQVLFGVKTIGSGLEDNLDFKVALWTYNGGGAENNLRGYLGADDNGGGKVYVFSTTAEVWETFYMERLFS